MAQQDIIDELNYLNETKGLIKQAIIDKGQEINNNTPFRTYASKISAIAGDNIIDVSNEPVSVSGSTLVFSNILSYIELEYIESTGTQYINTGVVFPSSGGKAIIDFCYTNNIMDVYICGTNGQFEAGKSDSVAFYSGSGFTYSQTSDMYARTIATGNNTGSNSNNIFLFARNWSGLYRPCAMKFYSAKFYNANNELVRDFIPVKRKSDNVICLYDKVSKQFFTNQGTGSFIAGPEI